MYVIPESGKYAYLDASNYSRDDDDDGGGGDLSENVNSPNVYGRLDERIRVNKRGKGKIGTSKILF